MIQRTKPMARMAVAIRRAFAMYDLDRCCAIWWLYRLHFGVTRDVMLGLSAVTIAQERSRCGTRNSGIERMPARPPNLPQVTRLAGGQKRYPNANRFKSLRANGPQITSSTGGCAVH